MPTKHSRTSKPLHIQSRKDARTALYRAVFGDQNWNANGKRSNLPWSDPTRSRPQGWSPQDALATVRSYKDLANLDHFAAAMVAHELQVEIQEVLA